MGELKERKKKLRLIKKTGDQTDDQGTFSNKNFV